MSDWQPIETAPRDGTIILVKNEQMAKPIEARWGDYYPSYGGPPKTAWSVWRDLDEFPCIPRGALVIPTEWKPVSQSSSDLSCGSGQ